MKRLAFVCVLLLAGCDTISPHESLVLMDSTIQSSAETAEVLLDEGAIDKKDACYVLVAGRIAAAGVDSGWRALFVQDWDGVQVYVDQARQALQGLTDAVVRAQQLKCGDL